MTHFNFSATGLLCSLLALAGCAGVAPVPNSANGQEQHPLVVAGLSEDLVFEYLLGDVAARRGDPVTAAQAMARAAILSGNARITVRAFALAIEVGEFERALELSELLVSITPEEPGAALTMRLQALILLDREQAVFDALVELIDTMPEQTAVLLKHIAQILGQQADPGRWLGLMQRIATHYHELDSVQWAAAWLGYRVGDEEAAQAALDRAMELTPGWEEAALLKFSYLREHADRERVSAYANEYLDTYADRPRFRLTYARLLAQWNENRAALAQFEKLLESDPDSIDALYAAGALNLDRGDLVRAREHFEHVLTLFPNEDRARLYLGRIASEQGDYEAALTLLREVVSRELYFDAQMRVGFVLSDAGRIDEALEHLADATPKSRDEQVRVYLAREQVLRDSGQPEQALKLLNAALVDLPDDLDLLYARGLVTAMLDQVVDHERDMRRLIELDPQNAHAYNALGYTLADKTERFEEALALIEKALLLLPGDPYILDSLGWVHYRRGNLKLALEYLTEAMDQQPDAEIAAHLGEVLWHLGAKAEAILAWEDGKSNDSDNPVLIDTLRKFGQ
ncbi:MAG: tetratricopeptide repeat protein [Arenicellales bacterium]|nr:tetratricopeptide repeat protein [Arenicellales bacterium]